MSVSCPRGYSKVLTFPLDRACLISEGLGLEEGEEAGGDDEQGARTGGGGAVHVGGDGRDRGGRGTAGGGGLVGLGRGNAGDGAVGTGPSSAIAGTGSRADGGGLIVDFSLGDDGLGGGLLGGGGDGSRGGLGSGGGLGLSGGDLGLSGGGLRLSRGSGRLNGSGGSRRGLSGAGEGGVGHESTINVVSRGALDQVHAVRAAPGVSGGVVTAVVTIITRVSGAVGAADLRISRVVAVSGRVVGSASLIAGTTGLGAGVAVTTDRLLGLVPVGVATSEAETQDGALDQLVRLGLGGDVGNAGHEGDGDGRAEEHLD